MHIVNIMFSRGGGGIEQAFVDYCEGLRDLGHRVTALVYPGAVVHDQLMKLGVPTITMRNFGEWDILAVHRLRHHLKGLRPDVSIAHANRAYSLGRRAVRGKHPLVAVAQNYSTARFTNADAVFTTTHDLVAHLVKQGVPEDRVFHIPNMVRCHELPHRRNRNDPPVIGAVGRFVTKKGFHIFIEALRILKERGRKFQAVLGGSGVEGPKLRDQSIRAGLEGILRFPGWIEDKRSFYTGLDIFCLPSLHEPFGIVLLEAFTYGTPVISTDSEGPRDIITPNYDAMVVKMDDAEELASAMARLLDDTKLADDVAANAFAKAKTKYAIEVVCQKIAQSLAVIITRHAEAWSARKAA